MPTDNLSATMQGLCAKYGPRVFLQYRPQDDRLVRITYARFDQAVQDWAGFLLDRGVKVGDRVAIVSPKSPFQILAFYACWRIGVIAVPISEGLSELEMGFIVRDAEPTLILVDPSVADTVRETVGDSPPVLLFTDLPGEDAPARQVPVHPNQGEDVAALIYTSGSTGMPKGVMLTHRNFSVNSTSALRCVDINEQDTLMSLLPYWHSFALVVEVITAPLAGAQLAVPRDKRDFMRNIGTYRPTIILVVPRIADAIKTGLEKKISESSPRVQSIFNKAIYNASRIFTAGPRLDGGLLRLVTHHFLFDPLVFRKIRHGFGGRVRFIVSGGAPLDIEHQIFFKYLGMPVYQGYGLTESTPVISTNSPHRHRLGSCGQVLDWLAEAGGGDYTFRNDEGRTGKQIEGELLVRGDCVMKGYWRHTDASAKTLADGWLHTGDVGHIDEDGYLYISGRRGNMIVLVGGEKLHPEHVEDAVKSGGVITECMVIGEKCKNVYVCLNVNEEWLKATPAADRLPALRRLVAERSAHLAPYERPKDVLILPDFTVDDGTLTVTLKVRRHRIGEIHGDTIRGFLQQCGEEIATKETIGIASSRVMETLKQNPYG